jgi:hypothetical protein
MPDCWLEVSLHPEGHATGHLNQGFPFLLQTRPIVREGAPHQQTRNCLKIIREGEKLVSEPQMGA